MIIAALRVCTILHRLGCHDCLEAVDSHSIIRKSALSGNGRHSKSEHRTFLASPSTRNERFTPRFCLQTGVRMACTLRWDSSMVMSASGMEKGWRRSLLSGEGAMGFIHTYRVLCSWQRHMDDVLGKQSALTHASTITHDSLVH